MKSQIQNMLDESAETRDAIREVVNASVKVKDHGYAYAAGSLSVLLEDAIALLPKMQRARFRERLYRIATQQIKKVA